MDRRAELGRMLEGYRAADAVEEGHLERMRALLASEGDPFARARYAPGHFTASAFVLSPDRRALLMILHGKLGLWLQPGGHIDPEDAGVLSAARREVAEEAGLTALRTIGEGLFDLDVHPIPAHKVSARQETPAHEHFDLRFLFVAASSDFTAGAEVRGARWVPLGEVEDAGTDGSVLRAVEKIRALEGEGPEGARA